jgi:hypothetical protein
MRGLFAIFQASGWPLKNQSSQISTVSRPIPIEIRPFETNQNVPEPCSTQKIFRLDPSKFGLNLGGFVSIVPDFVSFLGLVFVRSSLELGLCDLLRSCRSIDVALRICCLLNSI